MGIVKIKKNECGFILYVTMIMLIIFAIIGISLYQQTSTATVTVQYVSFKQEAEDLALKAINKLEYGVQGGGATILGVCEELEPADKDDKAKIADMAMLCSSIPSDMVSQAVADLGSGNEKPKDFTPVDGTVPRKWTKLTSVDSFSENGEVYYVVQSLGEDNQTLGYLLYRITVIAGVLGSYTAADSIYAKPKDNNSGIDDDDYWW